MVASFFLDRVTLILPRQESKPRKSCISTKVWGRNAVKKIGVCWGGGSILVAWNKIHTPGALLIEFIAKRPVYAKVELEAWQGCRGYILQHVHFLEVRGYFKKLREFIFSRASWEVLGWGIFDDPMLHGSSPKTHGDCGKGILPFEDEAHGDYGKPQTVTWQTSFVKSKLLYFLKKKMLSTEN